MGCYDAPIVLFQPEIAKQIAPEAAASDEEEELQRAIILSLEPSLQGGGLQTQGHDSGPGSQSDDTIKPLTLPVPQNGRCFWLSLGLVPIFLAHPLGLPQPGVPPNRTGGTGTGQ